MNCNSIAYYTKYTSLQAQAAAAMGTIAKSAGSNMNSDLLDKLLVALLSGLSGRTWQGKVTFKL